MSTLSAIRSEIIEDLHKYGVSDDSELDLELISDKIVSANLSVLKKFYGEKMPLEGFYQLLNSLTVECYKDTRRVGNLTFTDKTNYYKADIPPLIKTIGWANVKYFGMHGFDKNLDRLDLSEFSSRKGARYTSESPCYTIIGDILIAKHLPEGFTFGLMMAILADPRTAPDWGDETSDFPTPSEEGIKIIVKNSIIQTPGTPDLVNDAQRAMQQGNEKPQKAQQPDE